MHSPHYDAQSSGTRLTWRSTRQRRLIFGALLLAAFVPFVRALAFGFVYDDTYIVQHNPAIIGWRSLLTLWRLPYWTDAEGAQAGLYRPIHTLFLAIIRNAGGGWPLWLHLYAILLHVGATLLLWRMLGRGVRRWPATLAALWFAVHPVHVEAVANISNSAESLVACWTLGLYFVLANVAEREATWRDALIAAGLFFLALLSKESGAMSLAIALLAAVAWRPRGDATTTRPLVNDAARRPLLVALGLQWRRVALAGLAALALVAIMRSIVLGSSSSDVSMAAVGIDNMSSPQRASAMLSLGTSGGAMAFGDGGAGGEPLRNCRGVDSGACRSTFPYRAPERPWVPAFRARWRGGNDPVGPRGNAAFAVLAFSFAIVEAGWVADRFVPFVFLIAITTIVASAVSAAMSNTRTTRRLPRDLRPLRSPSRNDGGGRGA